MTLIQVDRLRRMCKILGTKSQVAFVFGFQYLSHSPFLTKYHQERTTSMLCQIRFCQGRYIVFIDTLMRILSLREYKILLKRYTLSYTFYNKEG